MKKLFAFLVLATATSAFAATPNMNGKWTVHQNVAGNETDQACTFTVDGSKLTGTCKGDDDKDLPVTGSVEGDKVSWKVESEYNGTAMTIVFTVSGTEGDKVVGSLEVQPFGVNGEFSASPAKSAAK